MLPRLRFGHRIGLLVLLAAIGLLAITVVTLVLGRRSARELSGIETRYVPLIELDRDLKAMFAEILGSLEDAASAADESRLGDADRLDRELVQRLVAGRATIASNGGDPATLERAYRAYYTSARGVAAALVAGTPAPQLEAEIAQMRQARDAFTTQRDAATTPDRRRLAAAFAAARRSQEHALWIETAVALGAIVMLALLSWGITRRTVRSLREVSVGVQRLASGELGQEIVVPSGDEIGDLAREANRTAAQLRDYRERTESLLAETQRQVRSLQEAERDLRRAKDAAENASRELEAFSYSVAHDLRAPLRAINGFSAALVEDLGGELRDEPKEHLERIGAAAVRMGHLIDALLQLSRVSRVDLTRDSVDLTRIVQDVRTQLAVSDPDRVVDWVIAPDVVAEGDPHLLRVLFENLLGNAWKFTAKRARARIEFGRSADPEPVYVVRDNGAGFDMAYASKLFTPFQRLHGAKEYAGTGIGLATVQRIVRRHGGRIWGEGAVDQGASFYFTLR